MWSARSSGPHARFGRSVGRLRADASLISTIIGTPGWIPRLGKMADDPYARYFADREQDERAMSDRATDQQVAAVHTEMADRYEALAVVFGVKRAAGRRGRS